MNRCLGIMAAALLLLPLGLAGPTAVSASVIQVNTIDPVYTAPQSWYQFDTRPGGSAIIEDLTGTGGNLEGSQPLPNGAARLETDPTNAAKAEIGVSDDYGTAGSILPTLNLAYSYYKVAGGAPAPAPSMKLTFFNPSYVGDGFGTLVYEAYQNGPTPPVNTWTDVSIGPDTGLWWWTGGFGVGSGFGGCPCLTLNDWLTTLDDGFLDAALTNVSMGLGTFNPGQIGYFDDVSIAFGGKYDVTYDFEVASLPEPGTMAVLSFGLLGLGMAAARRRRNTH